MGQSLTVYYSPWTRYDKDNGHLPFSGASGRMFIHRTFDTIPDLKVDIRIPDSPSYALPPRTTHALILGADAAGIILGDKNINKLRGYRKSLGAVPTMVTYSHMDCWDFREDDEESPASDNDKDVAVTKRSNYLYWALTDFKKLFTPILPHSARVTDLNPSPLLLADLLDRAPSNTIISLDIETRPQDNTLDCIGFGILAKGTWYIYTLRIYGPDNFLCHPQFATARFWRAFYRALLRPDILWVGHNLAFDLSILFHCYGLPFPHRIHDTMLSMHRINPFADKSLSHAISQFTDARENHKGNFVPNTSDTNFRQLLTYNSDDVYWTGEVYLRQLGYPNQPAIAQANQSQYVCLIMSFTGIEIDEAALAIKKEELTLKESQLLRVIRILTGIPTFNPNSGPQIAEYFFDKLDYEPLSLTDSGAPATDEKSLLELQLKQSNPLIPLILEFKAVSKASSMLNFKPYQRLNVS